MAFAVVVFAVLSAAATALAKPGDLDPTFGENGRLTLDFGTHFDRANAVALQSDGKIVLAGTDALSTRRANFALARLNLDGTLDRTFSGDGLRTVAFRHHADDEAGAVAIKPNGKIVVAGNSNGGAVATRLNTDGTLDRNFASNGRAAIAPWFDVSGVALQADGRIVVVGTNWALSDTRIGVARLRPNGSLDRDFAGDGSRTITFPANDGYNAGTAYAGGVAIQSDGKIVIAGGTFDPGLRFGVARLTRAGRLDRAFGAAGEVTASFGRHLGAAAEGVAIQPSGKIVAAGEVGTDSRCQFAALRLRPSGHLDKRFSGDGKQTIDFGGHASIDECGAFAVASQQDGKTIMAGESPHLADGGNQMAVARLQKNGEPDASFGNDGRVAIGFGNGGRLDWGSGVALQPDGRIVVGGMSWQYAGQDFAVARFDGS